MHRAGNAGIEAVNGAQNFDRLFRVVQLVSLERGFVRAFLSGGIARAGVMLPYSPLHHLLPDEFDGPLVATSGNISGEPVLTENDDVNQHLSHVADAGLHHDRPIQRPADAPVYRVIAGFARPLRHGRGTAPLELTLPFTLEKPVLAVGGHMKNTVALAWDDRIVVSPHIGDLDAPRSLSVFEQVITDLQNLYGVRAQSIVCDAHPVYVSSRWPAGHAGVASLRARLGPRRRACGCE